MAEQATDLSVDGVQTNSYYTVTLSWVAADEADGGYRVYDSVNGAPATVVGFTNSQNETTTSFVVIATGTHEFTVTAIDGGVEGLPSEPVVAVIGQSVSSDVMKVRALIPDLDATDYIFTNLQIDLYLEIYAGNVRRAAAAAINAIAVDEALLLKVVRTDDLSVNGAQVAEVLRKRAQDLNTEADALDTAAADIFMLAGGYPREPYIVPEATAWPWRA